MEILNNEKSKIKKTPSGKMIRVLQEELRKQIRINVALNTEITELRKKAYIYDFLTEEI